MNQKIPIHELSSRIALATGISEDSAEIFVKNFFDILSEELVKGETVKIKGLGEFSLSNANSETTVEFVPDKDLAEALNAPFSIFEPVTLNDEVTDSMLDIKDDETTSVQWLEPIESAESIESVESVESVEKTETVETVQVSQVSDKAASAEADNNEPLPHTTPLASTVSPVQAELKVKVEEATESAVESAPAIDSAKTHTPTILEEDPEVFVERENTGSSNGNFWWGLILGFIVGLAIGACGVYLAIDHLFPGGRQQAPVLEQIDETGLTDETATAADANLQKDIVADSVTVTEAKTIETSASEQTGVQAPAEPQPTIRKDTVRKGYLIHDMAKKYFGNKVYWVYIYEENKDKISNPNNMQPGDVLVIPAAEKYGIEPGNPESMKKAQQKAGEILAKYPR